MIRIMNDRPDPPSSVELEARIVRLESHLAEVERLVDELNQVVVDQGKALRRMGAQYQEFALTVQTFEMERIRSTNAKPPHSEI